MTSETRQFTDVLPNSPSGGFKLEYDYTMNGQLKSLKDPFGQQINYAFDKIGRLNNVTGSTAFAGVTNYASTPKYNARGILTHLNYGNGVETNITSFNNKLQATNFEVKKGTTSIVKKNYEFYDDASLKYSQDVNNPIFDRSYKYDFASRLTEAKTGAEARGGTVAQSDQKTQLPYRQSYNYNVYGQLTQRNNLHWGIDRWSGRDNNLSYNYQNNRITNTGNVYDADGRSLSSAADNTSATYDAKGEMTRISTPRSTDIYRFNNAAGREEKRKTIRWIIDSDGVGAWSTDPEIEYYIRSSLLGNEIVSEVNSLGKKQKTFVTGGGNLIATQSRWLNDTERVTFTHTDASGVSSKTTLTDGTAMFDEGTDDSPVERDGLGGNAGISTVRR